MIRTQWGALEEEGFARFLRGRCIRMKFCPRLRPGLTHSKTQTWETLTHRKLSFSFEMQIPVFSQSRSNQTLTQKMQTTGQPQWRGPELTWNDLQGEGQGRARVEPGETERYRVGRRST